jgi:hypothetical protein
MKHPQRRIVHKWDYEYPINLWERWPWWFRWPMAIAAILYFGGGLLIGLLGLLGLLHP